MAAADGARGDRTDRGSLDAQQHRRAGDRDDRALRFRLKAEGLALEPFQLGELRTDERDGDPDLLAVLAGEKFLELGPGLGDDGRVTTEGEVTLFGLVLSGADLDRHRRLVAVRRA